MSSPCAWVSSVFSPSATKHRLLHESGPGAYRRKVDPWLLLFALLESYLVLAPGLRSIAARHGGSLGTRHISALSYALGGRLVLELVIRALELLAGPERPLRRDIVVLDSMAVSLPKTRRHNCARMNNQTVGGGVLWAFCLTARRACSPVRVLAMMDGAWHDGTVMRGVTLAKGPLYIMDRGFYVIDLLAGWGRAGVRFLVRARAGDLVYTRERGLGGEGRRLRAKTSARGNKRTVHVLFDGIATLGAQGRRGQRPTVRLLDLELRRGEKTERLILVSSEMGSGAQQLLDLYGRRWEIEEFHRLLKRTVGLAHLYSFRQRGIKTLLAAATLLAVLLWMTPGEKDDAATAQTIPRTLRKLLRQARLALGITDPWKPNTIAKSHWRHRA